MSRESRSKNSRNRDFWRAVRFLGPYRSLVARSIVSALIAGTLMTAGLPMMVPVLRVLINGETVQEWVASIKPTNSTKYYLPYLQKIADLMPTDKVQTVAIIFVTV